MRLGFWVGGFGVRGFGVRVGGEPKCGIVLGEGVVVGGGGGVLVGGVGALVGAEESFASARCVLFVAGLVEDGVCGEGEGCAQDDCCSRCLWPVSSLWV